MVIIWMVLMMMNPITCKVECQECGLDFLRLALAVDLEKKEPLVLVASSSSSLLTPIPPLPFTIVVSVSARGLPSRPFPSTRDRFRENINISRLPSTFDQARNNITTFSVWFLHEKLLGLHISSQGKGARRWKRQSHTEPGCQCQHRGRSASQNPPSSN